MRLIYALLFSALALFCYSASRGQTVTCPPNLDFEGGDLSQWNFYTGWCCPISATSSTSAVSGRHTLTSGTGNDYYGGFPVVAPGGGSYSMKLGNDNVGAEAERARYYVHVPAGVSNYSLIYRYAVVFEDPAHYAYEQPRFEVKAYDSATNNLITCAQHSYVAAGSLAGFTLSSATYAWNVWYKPWSTGILDLSGYGGQTIAVDFAAGDCALGGHFGYGYVDMSCGLFQIMSVNCGSSATVTLTAPPGFQTYTWKNATYSTTVGTGQTITVPTPSTSTQYHVVLQPYAGSGCSDTLSTLVTVSNLTIAPSADTAICPGASIPITAGATSTAGSISCVWTPSAGLSCDTCGTPTATPASTTTYKVTVTDAVGCTKTDSVKITVSPLVTAAMTAPVVCYGDSTGAVVAAVTSGIGPYSYAWNSAPPQTSLSATGLPAGTYTVTVTDSIGCTNTASATVTGPAVPLVPTASTTPVACFGGNGTATVTPAGGALPYSYSWSSGAATATATGLAAGTYTATVTDAAGCVRTAPATVVGPATPLSVSTAPSSINCAGSTGTATATPVGGTGPYAFSWSTVPVQTGATAAGLLPGTYTVTVTDAAGCTAVSTVTMAGPSTPVAAGGSATAAVCYGAPGSATLTPLSGTGPFTYSWVGSTGTTATAALSAGIYTGIVTDVWGCADSVVLTISQPAQLFATAVNTTIPKCFYDPAGTATGAALGGTPPYAYAWSTGGAGTAASALPGGVHTLTVTDAAGCTATDTVKIPNQPFPTVSAGPDLRRCGPGAVDLTATGAATYVWSPAFGLSCTACPTPVATIGAPAVYTVIGTDASGCSDTDEVYIRPIPDSIQTSVGPTLYICAGQSAALLATGGAAYAWTPFASLDDAASSTPMAAPAVTTTYAVAITKDACYTDTLSQEVVVYPVPEIRLGQDIYAPPGQVLRLQPEVLEGDVQRIAWTPPAGLSCADCEAPEVTTSSTITYTAVATNTLGCSDTDDITIHVACNDVAFFMANTFTPNADGENDRFYPQGRGISTVTRFAVYSRWGEVMYEAKALRANDPTQGWDGTKKGGHPLDSDVFVYVLETECASGERVVIKGDVSLLR